MHFVSVPLFAFLSSSAAKNNMIDSHFICSLHSTLWCGRHAVYFFLIPKLWPFIISSILWKWESFFSRSIPLWNNSEVEVCVLPVLFNNFPNNKVIIVCVNPNYYVSLFFLESSWGKAVYFYAYRNREFSTDADYSAQQFIHHHCYRNR